ncbi:F-box domain containing protein, partial [Tanacetum coccineum]
MTELPLDAIFDILSRLPAKSLARFRCVSKPWCAYIDDDYFGILHGERAVEELTPIMYDPNQSSITGLEIIKSKWGTLEAKKKKGMSLNRKFLFESCSTHHRRYFVGGSCNGLLYLFLDKNFSPTSLVVIHPLRLELYKLPPTMQRESEYSRGLGFDVSTNTFKM